MNSTAVSNTAPEECNQLNPTLLKIRASRPLGCTTPRAILIVAVFLLTLVCGSKDEKDKPPQPLKLTNVLSHKDIVKMPQGEREQIMRELSKNSQDDSYDGSFFDSKQMTGRIQV